MALNSLNESWLARLESYLVEERYVRQVVRSQLAVSHRFLHYLQSGNTRLEEAKPSNVKGYLQAQLVAFQKRWGRSPRDLVTWRYSHTAGVHHLLRLAQGEWPPIPRPTTPREIFHQQVTEPYIRWLAEVRGLARETIVKRRADASKFLVWLTEPVNPARLERLSVADIDGFLMAQAQVLRRPSRKVLSSSLRSFLQYLYREGWVSHDLSAIVTSPSLYAYEGIPSALREQDVAAVLRKTRRDLSPIGRRDFAILLLLSTYGLRAGEIVRLRLEDLDWRHQTFRVRRSKQGTQSVLPLMTFVGEALLRYLRYARPQTEAREVFIRAQAPYRPFRDGTSLHSVIAKRIRAAGVQTEGKRGPHALRHAAAVRLLRACVPLKTIADILGHASQNSTSIYLKLASEDLRQVGLEAPEVTS